MSEPPRIPSCLPSELDGTSLVDRMLEIKRDYAMEDDRSDAWFQQLKCLSKHPDKGKVLKRAVRDPEDLNPRDFVAVSYSFNSAWKSLEKCTMGFEVHGPEDNYIKKFKTRDIVLQRVLRYAKAVGTRFFWIDQECFNQKVPKERQDAMDSMDLVYKRSSYPVALLEITFGSGEVHLMGILMRRERHRSIGSMVNMLRHVQKDKWWERAWTFQEEYLASKKLNLLIRHSLKRGEHMDSTLAGIEGEVCVSATGFRERATEFLVDLQNNEETKNGLRETCASLLDTFRRYNIVAEITESAMGRAMSSSVFEDLERRNISKGYDFLPIAANVCDYGFRLRSNQLERRGSHSVGLCALTMYLMNGEIFRNDDAISNPTDDLGLSEYLNTISFDRLRPPSNIPNKLSWLKECRFWPAKLSKEGIITCGHIWSWEGGDPKAFGLNKFQRGRLLDLLNNLKQRGICEGLLRKLKLYLKQDEEPEHPLERAKNYMDTMAEEVVEAIRCGRRLYLATLEAPLEGSAVFVMGDDEGAGSSTDADSDGHDSQSDNTSHSGYDCPNEVSDSSEVTEEDFYVFTSSSKNHHVSMTVDVAETISAPKRPLMTITGWTNGLAFYDGMRPQKAVVRWPAAWKRRNKRKLPNVDRGGTASKFQRRS